MINLTKIFRMHDAKFFLVGMCVALLIEFLMTMYMKPNCIPKYWSVSKKDQPYFGTTDLSYAIKLAKKISVYCFVLTQANQQASQLHAQNTWLRRCTQYAFVSPEASSSVRTLKTKFNTLTYDRKSWATMRIALRALYDEKAPVSYYMKADHDDFIVLENVRYMLELEDPSEPFIIGRVHQPDANGGKLTGSAGYVLSRKALELIVTKGLDEKKECRNVNQPEDVQISICAEAVGVKVIDKLDFLGKSRFSNVSIEEMFGPYPNNTPRWYPVETDYTMPTFDLHKLPASPLLASFCKIDPTMMYVLEYLLYHLRPAGITHEWLYQSLNKTI